MTQRTVSVEVREGSGLITVGFPPANSLTPEVREELCSALKTLRQDAEVRSAVITGAGDRFFMAGAHVQSLLGLRGKEALHRVRAARVLMDELCGFPKPLIAAINGMCLGGGLELALCCDIRLAAEHTQFGFPEVGIGLMPGAGGTQRLPRTISPGLARYLIFSGERLGAREAREAGLVEKVVSGRDLLATALDLAGKINSQAPLAVRNAKKALNGAMDLGLEQGLNLENDLWADLFETSDKEEGIQAFLEKRRPSFRGV